MGSPDFDRYAMNAEIEAFCEKHILPKNTRYNLMLATEENSRSTSRTSGTPLDLAVTYSEKTDALKVAFERSGSGLTLSRAILSPTTSACG